MKRALAQIDPIFLRVEVWDRGRRGTVNVKLYHHGTAASAGAQFGVSNKLSFQELKFELEINEKTVLTREGPFIFRKTPSL